MQPVEILTVQENLILRARGSELLILASHVAQLQKRKTAKEFAAYFMDDALINRPARKLFEAWLRKDGSLWARIYRTVQDLQLSEAAEAAPPSKKEAPTVVSTTPAPKASPATTKKAAAEPEAKPVKKKATETPKKADEPKAAKEKADVKTTKKAATKAAPTAKAPAKKATTAAKKPAAKKSTGK